MRDCMSESRRRLLLLALGLGLTSCSQACEAMVRMYVPDQAFRAFNDRLILFARTQRLPMTCSPEYGCTLDGRGMRMDVVRFSQLADGRREFDAFLYPGMFWRAS